MPLNTNIETILTELGWGSGFRIPVANEENKRLEEEIEKKVKLKENISAKLDTTNERIKLMKKHISNLMAEQDVNQKLLNTHSAQLRSEDHYYRLSCSTESNIRQEARDFQREWKEVNELVSNIQKELEKVIKKIEVSKNTLKYDEKSLREMENVLNENEGNNQLMEQYMKEDLKEYKELELKRQKLSTELQTYRETIIKTTNDAQEMEISLSRTSALYEQSLSEYRQMFNQWKESVTMLQQRNDDIKKMIQDIEALHIVSNDKRGVLHESEIFLKGQIENNRQVQETIKKLEKKLDQIKKEQVKTREMSSSLDNQLVIQKNVMKEITQRLQQTRSDIKYKESQIKTKLSKIEKINIQIIDLTVKLQHISDQKVDMEGKAKELEEMTEEQEKRKSKMAREMNRLQTTNLRAVNQIKDLQNESIILKMQYEKEFKKLECLDKLYAKEEKVLEGKKELWYQVKFELQKSEMKLDRLRGSEHDKTEAEKKLNKIEELQNILNERTKVSKLLHKQITNLEDDMRKISNSLSSDDNELQYLRNKRQDLILLVNAGEKQIKAAQNRYEEKQVEESMLRLKVLQIEKMITNVGNNVYDLERYKLELDAAMQERRAEITVQKESLIVQKRIMENEHSELKSAISERKIRARQLQVRHDNLIALLGTDPGGTPVSTTHLKIQSAQERYLLQEQGDRLDEEIRKTEEEIQAMENTLRVINICNDKYKTNLTADHQNKSEVEEHKRLDEELQDAKQKLKQKKEELQSLTENMQKIQNEYMEILKVINDAQENKENKSQYLAELRQQNQEQKEKISRADKNLLNAKKSINQISESTGDPITVIQVEEVELRDLQEQNAIALQDIAEFTLKHMEVEGYVKRLLAAQNIELPSVQLSQTPGSSRSRSNTNSTGCPQKSTSNGSTQRSPKESIGHIVNIEPEFENVPGSLSRRSVKQKQLSVKTSLLSAKRNF